MGVWAEDAQEIGVPQVVDEVQKAKTEVEWNVEGYKTETVFLLAEDNDLLDTASSSSCDHTGCRSSMTPTEPNPAGLVDPLLDETAHCTISGRRCSMILGSGCSSSLGFCICSCSFPVVLKEVVGRLV